MSTITNTEFKLIISKEHNNQIAETDLSDPDFLYESPSIDFFIELTNSLSQKEIQSIIKNKNKFEEFNIKFKEITNQNINDYIDSQKGKIVSTPKIISKYGSRYLNKQGLNNSQKNSLKDSQIYTKKGDQNTDEYVLDPIHRGIDISNTTTDTTLYSLFEGEMYVLKQKDDELGGIILIRNYINVNENKDDKSVNTKKYTGLYIMYAHCQKYMPKDSTTLSDISSSTLIYIQDISANEVIGSYQTNKNPPHVHLEFLYTNKFDQNEKVTSFYDIRNSSKDIIRDNDNEFDPSFINMFSKFNKKISDESQKKEDFILKGTNNTSLNQYSIEIKNIDRFFKNNNYYYSEYFKIFFPQYYPVATNETISPSINNYRDMTRNVLTKSPEDPDASQRITLNIKNNMKYSGYNFKYSDLKVFNDMYLNKIKYISKNVIGLDEEKEISLSCMEFLKLLKENDNANKIKFFDEDSTFEEKKVLNDSHNYFFYLYIPLKLNFGSEHALDKVANNNSNDIDNKEIIDFISNLLFKQYPVYFLRLKFNDDNFQLKFVAKYVKESNSYELKIRDIDKSIFDEAYKYVDFIKFEHDPRGSSYYKSKKIEIKDYIADSQPETQFENHEILSKYIKVNGESEFRIINPGKALSFILYKNVIYFKFTQNMIKDVENILIFQSIYTGDFQSHMLVEKSDSDDGYQYYDNVIVFRNKFHFPDIDKNIIERYIYGKSSDEFSKTYNQVIKTDDILNPYVNIDLELYNEKSINESGDGLILVKDLIKRRSNDDTTTNSSNESISYNNLMFDYSYLNAYTSPFIISPFLNHQISLSDKIYTLKYDKKNIKDHYKELIKNISNPLFFNFIGGIGFTDSINAFKDSIKKDKNLNEIEKVRLDQFFKPSIDDSISSEYRFDFNHYCALDLKELYSQIICDILQIQIYPITDE